MTAVGCQGVTVRADAPEGARRVVAPEGALTAHLHALVHVLADLISARREAVVARALETAVDVTASAVPANILHAQTFVAVHAPSPGLVQHVSRRALASE